LDLAQKINGEIICADSWTVRREVNIGTAKPSQEDQQLVPHHLLDVVGPCEDFTAAVFKGLALKAIDNIASRGKVPIMVGGTGLYIDGVIYDYGFLERGDRTARTQLDKLDNAELIKRINSKGLELGSVDIRNKRRLVRLLETNGARPERAELRKNTLLLGLKAEKEVLKERITARVDAMLEAGLEVEVQQLSERYGWQCEALKGVGYAQWQNYFLSSETLADVRQKIIRASLDLAKRQRTWFKRNKSIQWIDTPVNLAKIVDITSTFLDKSNFHSL
jgi:tRNA dimethylallyltransferase